MATYPLHEETDDDLRAELQRRHPDRVHASIGSTVSLADFGDDSLRAECEWRKLSVGDDTRCSLAGEALPAERDEWRRRAEAAGRDHHTIVKRYADELADMKRRAEIAEERWRLIKETAIAAGLPEGVDTKSWLLASLARVQQDRQRYNANVYRGEDGKRGIKTLTLPSGRSVSEAVDVATLADLLADDAGTT